MIILHNILPLAVMMVSVVPTYSEAQDEPVDQGRVALGVMLDQLIQHHFTSCHLALITTSKYSSVLSSIISAGVEGVVVVESGSLFSQEQSAQDHLLQGLWGDTRTTCRALILDLTTTSSNNTNLALRLADISGMWRRLETYAVVVGGRAEVETVLLHPSLRNTVYAVYLAVTLLSPPLHDNSLLKATVIPQEMTWELVRAYWRCLYCDNGEANVQPIQHLNSNSLIQDPTSLFPEDFHNFMGHKYRVVAVRYFPYIDYKTDTAEPGSTVTPKDSIDFRILTTLAAALNFTYQIYEQRDRKWGVLTDGNFNGMMGDLQREESDFCMIAAPTPERLQVIDYTKGYTPDVMIVLSLKPTLLPENLALIRPFSGEVWLALLVSVAAWGMLLWLLQKAWWWVAGGRVVKFNTALLYGWGALLEHPPSDPSVSVSGQVLVGWWLVFCLIINTAFRSSLVAHLTVQGKSRSPESFRDLVERENWKWGSEGWFLTGVPLEYFSKHTDPVVQHIYKDMEVLVVEEAFQKVLAGSYSFITFKNYANVIIASSYTDSLGNSPFYLGKEEIPIFVVSGWGFRKGAPFHRRFSELIYRLEDAGIINYWIDDVIARRVRENREAAALVPHAGPAITSNVDSKQLPLGLQHLQGAFYLLLLGFTVALPILLRENLDHSHSTPQ